MPLQRLLGLVSRKLTAVRHVVAQQGLREVAVILGRWARAWLGVLDVALRGAARIDGLRLRLAGPAFPLWRRSSYWFDGFETRELAAVRRHFRRDLPAVELGGGMGVVACGTNRLLQQPTQHWVVEANPALWDLLETNRDLNGACFQLVRAALGYDDGHVVFHSDPRFFEQGSVLAQPGEGVPVPCTSLAAVAAAAGIERCNLVADIEGAEVHLVAREGRWLAEHVAVLVLEIHPEQIGAAAARDLVAQLRDLGFRLVARHEGGPAVVAAMANRRF